jgi:hypothetical protein
VLRREQALGPIVVLPLASSDVFVSLPAPAEGPRTHMSSESILSGVMLYVDRAVDRQPPEIQSFAASEVYE